MDIANIERFFVQAVRPFVAARLLSTHVTMQGVYVQYKPGGESLCVILYIQFIRKGDQKRVQFKRMYMLCMLVNYCLYTGIHNRFRQACQQQTSESQLLCKTWPEVADWSGWLRAASTCIACILWRCAWTRKPMYIYMHADHRTRMNRSCGVSLQAACRDDGAI